MRPTHKIDKLIKNLKLSASPKLDQRIDDLIDQSELRQSRPLDIRRIIMKSKISKFAVAALVMVAVLIAVNSLTVTKAWAIEQTIEALRDIKGIYLSGTSNYSGRPTERIEIWTRPHSENVSVSGDFHLHEGDSHISIASEARNMTYVYTTNPEQSVVYVSEGLNRHCQPFTTADLFTQLKEKAADWKEEYGKDPQTGRDSVFVTCKGFPVNTAPYWRLQFDLKTKFPVRAGVWFNSDYSGLPHFEFTTITYNPQMPDDLFEFTIPQDTQVIDCTQIRRLIDEVPDYGIRVDGLSTQEACKKVAQEYWQAVMDSNASMLSRLRPLVTEADWDRIFAIYAMNKPVKFTHTIMNHLNDPGTFVEVTCTLITQDGQTAQSTLNIDVRQTSRGILGVVTGVLGPELIFQD